jgi:hypothetical protein
MGTTLFTATTTTLTNNVAVGSTISSAKTTLIDNVLLGRAIVSSTNNTVAHGNNITINANTGEASFQDLVFGSSVSVSGNATNGCLAMFGVHDAVVSAATRQTNQNLFLFPAHSTHTNVRLGIATTTPQGSIDAGSALYPIVVPRMTTAARDAATPFVDGMILYNTTTAVFNLRQAGAWRAITTVAA